MSKKNILVYLFIAIMQLPYMIQWEHYITITHLLRKEKWNYNLSGDNYTHCYLIHKAPYSSFNSKEISFSLPLSSDEIIQPTSPTKNKEILLSLSFLLRAPPFFHFG